MRQYALIVVLIVLSLPIGQLLAQNKETAFANPVNIEGEADVVIFVDPSHASASDSNPGTANLPKASIAAATIDAIDNRTNELSTQILIAPGTYRETFRIDGNNLPDAPIIYEAIEPGSVALSGAEIWSDWESDNNIIYTHTWSYDWGLVENPWESLSRGYIPPITRHREQIFINGQPLQPVLTLQALYEGSFFVSEQNDLVTIWPFSGTDMEAAILEVAIQPEIARFENISNIAIKGISFEHTTSGPDQGAIVFRNCDTILVEDTTITWSNWAAIDTRYCKNVTMRNVVANHNGIRGIGAFSIDNLYLENITNNFNNWRGALGNWHDWDSGQKFLLIHGGIIRNFNAIGNEAPGLWIDFDNQDILVDNAHLCDNFLAGLVIEASQGPIIVRNSEICNNRAQASDGFWNGGIFSTYSDNVLLEDNLIYGNERAQIRYHRIEALREVSDRNTGDKSFPDFENWRIRNNLIFTTHPNQFLIDLVANVDVVSLISQNNIWYDHFNEESFHIGDRTLNFAEWQIESNGDLSSEFVDTIPSSFEDLIAQQSIRGLRGRYYNAVDRSELTHDIVDTSINFADKSVSIVMPTLFDQGNFAVTWTGALTAPETTTYTFILQTNGTAMLSLAGEQLISITASDAEDLEESYVTILMEANQIYELQVDFDAPDGESTIMLQWHYGDQPKQIVPVGVLSPA